MPANIKDGYFQLLIENSKLFLRFSYHRFSKSCKSFSKRKKKKKLPESFVLQKNSAKDARREGVKRSPMLGNFWRFTPFSKIALPPPPPNKNLSCVILCFMVKSLHANSTIHSY